MTTQHFNSRRFTRGESSGADYGGSVARERHACAGRLRPHIRNPGWIERRFIHRRNRQRNLLQLSARRTVTDSAVRQDPVTLIASSPLQQAERPGETSGLSVSGVLTFTRVRNVAQNADTRRQFPEPVSSFPSERVVRNDVTDR